MPIPPAFRETEAVYLHLGKVLCNVEERGCLGTRGHFSADVDVSYNNDTVNRRNYPCLLQIHFCRVQITPRNIPLGKELFASFKSPFCVEEVSR